MIRIFDEDGTLHFSQFKKLSLSGADYLHAVNNPIEPTRAMRIGTVVHYLILGARPSAKRLVKWEADRRGKEWLAFAAKNADAEIISAAEWEEAVAIAEGVMMSPVARARLQNARFEVPLTWEESGIKCSTSGVDIFPVGGDLGDLKATQTTHPETFKRHAFNMLYPQQLAFYRRGARANGIDVKDLFILGVSSKPPHLVVELVLTESLIEEAEKSVSAWFEELRKNMLSVPEPRTVYDWPGYAESSITWDVPAWKRDVAAEIIDDEEAA